MRGLPVTIRLLDPPLHEFLPKSEEEIAEVAAAMKVDPALLRDRVIALTESNPMLGHRGCRLLITYPEIAEMQTRAILEAAAEAAKADRRAGDAGDHGAARRHAERARPRAARRSTRPRSRCAENGGAVEYSVGTMIELPRAALRAQEIAEGADFFSFGTNDLTQTTFGISRDDAAGFIGAYQELGLIEKDPFMTLDTEGVGVLVRVARERGRKAKPELKLGICGEHGGDPASIRFCDASASTTSPARPSACRSPASPPRRRRSPTAAHCRSRRSASRPCNGSAVRKVTQRNSRRIIAR